jgi:L-alanine-DL-glutamate epimerase-like enolase superfamily enzyme
MPDNDLHVELKTLRLIEPFRIAHGTSSERQVLRVHWRGAIGEAPFVPYYGDEPSEATTWLRGLDWNGEAVPAEGPRVARLALDLLRHDWLGKEQGTPLWKTLLHKPDTAQWQPMQGGRSLGIPTDLDSFADRVKQVATQFRVLKLKLGSGNVDFDEAIAATAREAAPQVALFADANGGWSIADSVKIIPRLARHGLKFIEQPIHHAGGVEAWRELRACLPGDTLPLFADESAQTADDVPKLAGLVHGVNVKLLKCGGLIQARTMIEVAHQHKMSALLGCMIESSIGVTAAAHLAPLADWIDLDGHLYVANDDFGGLTYDEEGRICLGAGAGLGVVERSG